MFLLITLITFGVQILMVQYAGRFMTVVALNWLENVVCLVFGAFSLVWGIIIKVILPSRWFACLAMNEKEMTEAQKASKFTGSFKKSATDKSKKRSEVAGKALEKAWY